MLHHVLSKRNPPYVRLLDSLGDSNVLTLFVGAGASADAGLPQWGRLVKTYLENGFREAIDTDLIDSSCDPAILAEQVLMQNRDVVAAASIGRYLHEDRRDDAIKSALYRGVRARPRAGRVVTAIAAVAAVYGSRLRILTTNYDDLIEHELTAGGVGTPTTLVPDSGGFASVVVGDVGIDIYHLHGYAPYHGRIFGPLVLDERDFALARARPPIDTLPDLLNADPLLFVGTSMTDTNLVAACHIARSRWAHQELPWFGLFVNPRDGRFDPAIERVVHARLQRIGINPLQLVSYGQISQVLYELVLRVAVGAESYWADSAPTRYGLRLTDWRRGLDARYPAVTGGDGFGEQQDDVHHQLAQTMNSLRGTILLGCHADEGLALHLWVRKPDDTSLGYLELWGSSSHRHREPWSLAAARLTLDIETSEPAARCVFYASQYRRTAATTGARWQGVVAVPIILPERPWNDLVVGAITLSTTLPLSESAVGEKTSSLAAELEVLGTRLLDPNGQVLGSV